MHQKLSCVMVKRMLQEAVDALFDNGRNSNAVKGANKATAKVSIRDY